MSSTPPPSLPPVARVRACPQVWDVVRSRCVRVMAGHRMRCGTLSWAAHLLSTGSRDRSVLHRDVRSPADFVARLSGHKSEVCGLKWSPDERELASGGNDNQVRGGVGKRQPGERRREVVFRRGEGMACVGFGRSTCLRTHSFLLLHYRVAQWWMCVALTCIAWSDSSALVQHLFLACAYGLCMHVCMPPFLSSRFSSLPLPSPPLSPSPSLPSPPPFLSCFSPRPVAHLEPVVLPACHPLPAAPGSRQGACLVATSARAAGVRGWHGGPLHSLLEHHHRQQPVLHGHGQPGRGVAQGVH